MLYNSNINTNDLSVTLDTDFLKSAFSFTNELFPLSPVRTPLCIATHGSEKIIKISVHNKTDLIAIGYGKIFKIRSKRTFSKKYGISMISPLLITLKWKTYIVEIYKKLFFELMQNKFVNLEIGTTWGEDFTEYSFFKPYITRKNIEFLLDTRISKKDVYSNFHKKHRKNIRFAINNNVLTKHDNSYGSFIDLINFQKSSSDRGKHRGNIFKIPKSSIYKDMYMQIYKNGIGHVFYAEHSGYNIAALAFLEFNNMIITVRSGALPIGYSLSAMYLLHDQLIKYAYDVGVHTINLGGVPADAKSPNNISHGLFKFKKYFGGTEHFRTGLNVNLRNFST